MSEAAELTYQEVIDAMIAKGKPRDEIVDYVKQNNEHVIDFDNLPKQQHNWHDQGLKLSCWDAGHPMHQVWIPGKK